MIFNFCLKMSEALKVVRVSVVIVVVLSLMCSISYWTFPMSFSRGSFPDISDKLFPIRVSRIYSAGGCSFNPLDFKINGSVP